MEQQRKMDRCQDGLKNVRGYRVKSTTPKILGLTTVTTSYP